MGAEAAVETAFDRLQIFCPDGVIGGKWLLHLLEGLQPAWGEPRDAARAAAIQPWLDGLDAAAGRPLAPLVRPLLGAWYDGSWGDYTEDDYAEYQAGRREHAVTETEFIATVRRIEGCWTSIDDLLVGVRALTDALMSVKDGYPTWYLPFHTVWDLWALAQNLELARSRFTGTARIRIT